MTGSNTHVAISICYSHQHLVIVGATGNINHFDEETVINVQILGFFQFFFQIILIL